MWRAAMDDNDEEGAAVLDEAAAKVACREVIQHTNPFGSVQHCPDRSTQASPSTSMSVPHSLSDHLAGDRLHPAQQATAHCPTTGVVSSCQPSIWDRAARLRALQTTLSLV